MSDPLAHPSTNDTPEYSDPLAPPLSTNDTPEYNVGEEAKGGEEEIPIAYQLEIVDMSNEDMDMLEWLVRRWIPIPKQYYWDTPGGGGGNNGESLPWKTRAWHNFVGGGSRAIRFIERVGKPVTEATGLTGSRFEYVKETMSERQLQKSKEAASQRKLQIQDSRRNLKAEEGVL